MRAQVTPPHPPSAPSPGVHLRMNTSRRVAGVAEDQHARSIRQGTPQLLRRQQELLLKKKNAQCIALHSITPVYCTNNNATLSTTKLHYYDKIPLQLYVKPSYRLKVVNISQAGHHKLVRESAKTKKNYTIHHTSDNRAIANQHSNASRK